jgi:hypothetical protein
MLLYGSYISGARLKWRHLFSLSTLSCFDNYLVFFLNILYLTMSYPCQKKRIWKIYGLVLYQVAFLNITFSFVQILFWKYLFIMHARVNFGKFNLKII